MTLAVVVLFAANIFWGSVEIPPSEIIDVIFGNGQHHQVNYYIIFESRIPQAITALLSGAALATSGLLLQTTFRNPLAGPSILGITSGSSLGVALVILLFGGVVSIGEETLAGGAAVITAALFGGFAVLSILIGMSSRIRNNLSLLIAGMMAGYLTSSLVTLLTSLSSARGVQSYVMWGMGTFSIVTLHNLPLFATLILAGLTFSVFLAKPLNLLLLGDNYAANLGVNVKSVRNQLLIVTGLLSSVVTAFCGPIGFIGMAMPHIARMTVKTDDHIRLLPATMLCGAALALGCNLCSSIPEGSIIPINALTPLAGVPVVLYVLLRKRIF